MAEGYKNLIDGLKAMAERAAIAAEALENSSSIDEVEEKLDIDTANDLVDLPLFETLEDAKEADQIDPQNNLRRLANGVGKFVVEDE